MLVEQINHPDNMLLTRVLYMRKDYSHGTCVEDFLDESIAALMWHSYKWCYTESKSGAT